MATAPDDAFSSKAPFVWLGVALVSAAAAAFWHLTASSLYVDEGFTFHMAGKPVPALLHEVVYHDFHPPLFYLMTHYLVRWLHWQPWNYRYLTAVLGLVSIVTTWTIARRLFGEVGAACAASLVALSPLMITWDRTYFVYAVFVAANTLSWWFVIKLDSLENRRAGLLWPAYALTVIVVPYLHYLGLLSVICQALYALARPRKRWPLALCLSASAAAFAPWLRAVEVQFPHGAMVIAQWHVPWLVLARQLMGNGLPLAWYGDTRFDWCFSIAVVSAIAAGAWLARRSALPFWFLTLFLQCLISAWLSKDLLEPRMLAYVVPAAAIAVGGVVHALMRTRVCTMALAVWTTAVAISAIAVVDILFVPFYQRADWYAVNLVLLQNEKAGDIIVLDQGAEYWVARDFTGFRHHALSAPTLPSDIRPTIAWLQAHTKQRVWYIDNNPFYPDPNRKILAALDRTRSKLLDWREPRLSAYDYVYVGLFGSVRQHRNVSATPSRRIRSSL